jgi:hypothetical protein
MFRSNSSFSGRATGTVLAGCLAAAAWGCGGQKLREGFVDMHGTVTLDKQPLPDAQVEIVTEKGTSYGRTDSSGRYVAEYSTGLKGAGKGPAKVKIRTSIVYPGEDTSSLKVDPKTGDFKKEEKVPAKYNTKTELKVDITEGDKPYDFELTSS